MNVSRCGETRYYTDFMPQSGLNESDISVMQNCPMTPDGAYYIIGITILCSLAISAIWYARYYETDIRDLEQSDWMKIAAIALAISGAIMFVFTKMYNL